MLDTEAHRRAVTRRSFLRHLGRASGTVLLLPAGTARASGGSVLYLQNFGARGNGKSDDTAAIQSALNAATSGMTVMGQAGAVYVISNTLSFPSGGVTLNLGGGAVRIGTTRVAGSALQTNDTMFSISGLNDVRITNGKILSAMSSYSSGGLPYRIHLAGGQSCQIDHLNAACDGSLFVYLSGAQHSISSNVINQGGISGLATTNVIVQGNALTNSPLDAIGFTGYQGAPVTGTQYLGNTISGYGRVAIEEYSPNGATYCVGSVFSGNTISAPAASNTSGTGISAISSGAKIQNNRITDAMAWAIEATGLGTIVTNNQIGWSSATSKAALGATAIVINTSLASDTDPVTVSGNTITGGAIGIQLYGDRFYCPVAISSNQLTNTISQGIALAPGASTGLVQANSNILNFNQPPQPNTTRLGIVTAQGAQLGGNQILYTTSTYRAGVYDIPYDFVGNAVAMTSNLADGGGRTDPYIASGSISGTWTDWTLTNNRFINGAPAYAARLSSPTLSGNVGLS